MFSLWLELAQGRTPKVLRFSVSWVTTNLYSAIVLSGCENYLRGLLENPRLCHDGFLFASGR